MLRGVDIERQFLISLVANQPDWQLLGIPQLEQLPGIRWKLQNLDRLQKTNAKKFVEQLDMLKQRLARAS